MWIQLVDIRMFWRAPQKSTDAHTTTTTTTTTSSFPPSIHHKTAYLDALGLGDLVDAHQRRVPDVVEDGAEDLGLGRVRLVRVRGGLRRAREPA